MDADFGEPTEADFGDPGPPVEEWRDDPAWKVVAYDREYFGSEGPPAKPPPAAELAQPDGWASLYEGRRLVATWSRIFVANMVRPAA